MKPEQLQTLLYCFAGAATGPPPGAGQRPRLLSVLLDKAMPWHLLSAAEAVSVLHAAQL